jgi:hypothetical protein
MARQMREDYALVWGGDERWLTTGTHVANLVADYLDTDAEEIAASQGAGESGEGER